MNIPMVFEDRLSEVELMHETMLSMNNEDAYMAWIWVMPDSPTRDDFKDFADSKKDFAELQETFSRIYARYKDDGLYKPSDEVLGFLDSEKMLDGVTIFK